MSRIVELTAAAQPVSDRIASLADTGSSETSTPWSRSAWVTLKFLDSSTGSAAFDTTVTEARTSNDEKSILTSIESMRGP